MKHEIIYTEHYALIVSDEQTKHGDFFISSQSVKPILQKYIDPYNQILITKKVIAHRPLTDVPILEGVPLLPKWGETEETIELNYYKELEDRREVARNFKGQVAGRHRDLFGNSEMHHMIRGFLEGYNKAKETYKYTEDDLIAFSNFVNTNLMHHSDSNGFYIGVRKVLELFKNIQQAKRPKYFECDMARITKFNGEPDYFEPNSKPNSQGQTELVGKYIYE